MNWTKIIKDLEFDEYGDIDLVSGDIAILSDQTSILRQNILDRIKTSFGDYDLYPKLGADLSGFIGKPNLKELSNRINENISYSLTFDGFLKRQDFDIEIVQEKESIYIKLEIPTLIRITSEDTLSINILFNTITGSIYAS